MGRFFLTAELQGKPISITSGFPDGSSGKEFARNAGDTGDAGSIAGLGLKTKWQPTPLFLPGISHGQGSPEGYTPYGHMT